MESIFHADAPAWQWASALGTVTLALLLGYLVRLLVVRKLRRAAAATATILDDILIDALGRRLPVWFALGGISAGARLSPLQEQNIARIDKLCGALFILSLSLAVAHIATAWLEGHVIKDSRGPALTGVSRTLLNLLIVTVGLLLMLAHLGISVAPALTALGVGSLAVALALQPMLSNLFAGLNLAVSRPIQVGDMVTLENGMKGQVQDIGWRATRILELSNNLIVVPNNRLSEMILVNHTMPNPSQALVLHVGVAYGSDLEKVERVFTEEARQIAAQIPGALPDPAPQVRFEAFGESAINVQVILRAQDFRDRMVLTHELIKRIKTRCDREGIDLPPPRRAVSGEIRITQAAP
jgi:small-conductance mechanosensitive channel